MGKQSVRYEDGQTAKAFEEPTNAGDNINFQASFFPISDAAGHEPVIAPYGLLTGGAVTTHASNDTVNVAAMTLQAPGMTGADANGEVAVSAGTLSISRGLTTDTHRITSITVNASGALAAVAGVDNTAFSEVRGADGGPPYIPVGSIEIAQVRVTSITAAVVAASEIFATPGVHLELADSPQATLDYATGNIEFSAALPLIHTGDEPKKVYIKGSTPIFTKLQNADNWVDARPSGSSSSVETYDGPIASRSSSLSTAGFTFYPGRDGNGHRLLEKRGENLWFEHKDDEDKSFPYRLTQGVLDISVTNPASGQKVATCTIVAEQETTDVKS